MGRHVTAGGGGGGLGVEDLLQVVGRGEVWHHTALLLVLVDLLLEVAALADQVRPLLGQLAVLLLQLRVFLHTTTCIQFNSVQ
jgi:hypothetical protein